VIKLTVSEGTANGNGNGSGPAATYGPASPAQAAAPPDCPASATPSAVPPGAAVTVPSVIGMSQLQAEQILTAAGFSVIVQPEAPPTQSVPAGEVWSQTVPAGAEAPRGTTITLYVAPN
jgi:hypothetical protein